MAWDARFSFFWYNDEELFNYTEGDFDRKAAALADAGINIVITFSCTHFRWTMRPYWDRINKTIENVVKACHRYGIKVVEHHSSHLTFDPLNEDDWNFMEMVLNKRGSSIASWEGIKEYIASDPVVNGVKLSSFRQIDGRTGEWARTPYHGYCMCFNNAGYRKAYFDYLELVYATGIDGIMTDDVQYFGQGNACTCEHCRRLFREGTGMELPQPGEAWKEFYGDYDNPVYVAWEQFRRNSTANFQREVNRHFEKLGLKMLRPNYVSGVLHSNPTGYPFDVIAPIWDWVFQENTFSSIIKYSWHSYAAEAVHRYALANRRNIPSMSLFYPDRDDSYYLTWALAQSWGQLYLATAEGHDMSKLEKKYRSFEKQYARFLQNQQKQADVAMYFSLKTRDYVKNAASTSMASLMAWMHAAYFANQATDMVFEDDSLSKLLEYRYILLPNVTMLSDDEILKLGIYARKGGTLVILGTAGERDDKGNVRDLGSVAAMLGFCRAPEKIPVGQGRNGVFHRNGAAVRITGLEYTHCFDKNGTFIPRVIDEDGRIVGAGCVSGEGEVIWIACSNLTEGGQKAVSADRWQKTPVVVDSPENSLQRLAEGPGALLSALIEKPMLDCTGIPEAWRLTCYKSHDGNALVVHIVNTGGLLAERAGIPVSHADISAPFLEPAGGSGKDDTSVSRLAVRLGEGVKPCSAMLYTPERNEGLNIVFECREDGYTELCIPHSAFSGYAFAAVELPA